MIRIRKERADIVIADLPCSGLGVLGKKPDLRYKMNEKTETDLVELQRKILSVVKDYVKPDGSFCIVPVPYRVQRRE